MTKNRDDFYHMLYDSDRFFVVFHLLTYPPLAYAIGEAEHYVSGGGDGAF
jgi:hypothetical protein